PFTESCPMMAEAPCHGPSRDRYNEQQRKHAGMEPPFEDAIKTNRWFAVECNNAAWDIIEGGNRSPEAIDRMITAAHAARWHWQRAGATINEQRALSLLAYAYFTANNIPNALHYARAC